MMIKPVIHEPLERALLGGEIGREATSRPSGSSYIINAGHSLGPLGGLGDHIVDHPANLAAHQFAQPPVLRRSRKLALDRPPLVSHEIKRQQFVKLQESGAQAIVNVMVVIGDIIGNRRNLCLERGPGGQIQRIGRIKLGQGPVDRTDRAVVLG